MFVEFFSTTISGSEGTESRREPWVRFTGHLVMMGAYLSTVQWCGVVLYRRRE